MEALRAALAGLLGTRPPRRQLAVAIRFTWSLNHARSRSAGARSGDRGPGESCAELRESLERSARSRRSRARSCSIASSTLLHRKMSRIRERGTSNPGRPGAGLE